jgi:hypothetical protein
MPIKVRCPDGHVLKISSKYAGKKVRCPKCKQTVVVPAAEKSKSKPKSKPKSESESKPTPGPPPRKSKSNDKADASRQKSSSEAAPPESAEKPPRPKRTEKKPASSRKPVEQEPVPTAPETSEEPPADELDTVEAPPTAEEIADATPVQGYEADEGKRVSVYGLAAMMVMLAIVNGIPAVWQVIQFVQAEQPYYLEPWTHMLLLLSGIQLTYAIYLAQLPDWSTTRVAMVFTALMTTFYAAGLGLATTAASDNQMIDFLGLNDELQAGRLTSWCLIMLALNGLVTYFNSRVSIRWHKSFMITASIPVEQTWEVDV